MRIEDGVKLNFDDVLIRPKRSEAPSRSSIDLDRHYDFLYSTQSWNGIPIIASNMDATGTIAMANALAPSFLTCLHKYYSKKALVDCFRDYMLNSCTFLTLGIGDDDFLKLKQISEDVEVKQVCIDVANGYSKYFVEHVQKIRQAFPKAIIMAGNVASSDMVQELLISGMADIIKIGIGPGSVCETRIKTGVGYPQLSAIIECADAAHGLGGHVCADGGCAMPGDVVKAFAAGADFVMLGGMLAGHDECEGEWSFDDQGNKKAMKFYGMASKIAADKYAGGLKDYRAAEGKEVWIPYKGSVKDTLQEITGGLRSACAYVGASCLKDLSKCTTFVRCR